MNDHSNEMTGWFVSIGIHGIIVLIFLYSQLDIKPFNLDFTPVTFASIQNYAVSASIRSVSERGGKPIVELPRRPMLDDTSPLLRLPDSDRIITATPPRLEKPDLTEKIFVSPSRRVDLTAVLPDKRERAPVEPIPLNDAVLTEPREDALSGQLAGEEMFTIKWEGPARIKTSGRLPEFPPGINKAATVRLEIVVAPDGSVVSAKPVTKGLPGLETVSIDALRTWRFNRLDRALVQSNQKGEITFRFVLK